MLKRRVAKPTEKAPKAKKPAKVVDPNAPKKKRGRPPLSEEVKAQRLAEKLAKKNEPKKPRGRPREDPNAVKPAKVKAVKASSVKSLPLMGDKPVVKRTKPGKPIVEATDSTSLGASLHGLIARVEELVSLLCLYKALAKEAKRNAKPGDQSLVLLKDQVHKTARGLRCVSNGVASFAGFSMQTVRETRWSLDAKSVACIASGIKRMTNKRRR